MSRSVQELAQTSINQVTLVFPKASNLLSKSTSQTVLMGMGPPFPLLLETLLKVTKWLLSGSWILHTSPWVLTPISAAG